MKGVLLIEVVKATNLPSSVPDGYILKGKTNPYVKITGSGLPKVSKLIENNLDPVWNEPFYFLIDEADKNPTLNVGVHHMDEHTDEFIGS